MFCCGGGAGLGVAPPSGDHPVEFDELAGDAGHLPG